MIKNLAIENIVDEYPELSPMERHILFLESRNVKISSKKYQELLKIYYIKETKKQTDETT